MSHELRTPLNAIGGYVELIEMGLRGPVTPEQREDLRRIRSSQRVLLRLVEDVLDVAKLETGRVQLEMTNVPVHEVLAGAERSCSHSSSPKRSSTVTGRSTHRRCPRRPHATAADRSQFDQQRHRSLLRPAERSHSVLRPAPTRCSSESRIVGEAFLPTCWRPSSSHSFGWRVGLPVPPKGRVSVCRSVGRSVAPWAGI